MIIFILQCMFGSTAAWISWSVLRRLLFLSPLDNIPGPPSAGFLMGNLGQLYNSNGWGFHQHLADAYGSVVKYGGLFGDRELYIFDPLALHHILLKDQDIFQRTSVFLEVHRILFGMGLISTIGDQHRKQRKMLSPAFSSASLRQLVPVFLKVAEKVRHVFESKVKDGPQEIEMVQWMARTSLEVIGQAGLGYSFDSLTEEEPSDPYVKSIKQLLPTVFSLSVILQLLPTMVLIPLFFRRILVHFIPSKSLRKLKGMVKIIDQTALAVFGEKRDALRGGGAQGKDIISILMKANMDADNESQLSDPELLAQISTLTFAATDTTSNALCRIFHLLSQHPDAQDKLRCEIVEARDKNGRHPSHDEIVALPMLDAVVKESLRLHPPTFSVSRTAGSDVVLPLSTPVRSVDGTLLTSIPIPKNTNIMIGITAANRSKAIWGEDASEWKPERWLVHGDTPGVGKDGVKLPGVYSNMLSFLGGGRGCIGFKFSELEIKVILFLFIGSFKFSPPEKEVTWVMSSLTFPMVDGKVQLPLNVELI